MTVREIPYSGRSENPLTRAAQDRDRELLPEPVQVLLRELFLRRDRHAQDEADIGAAIEEELAMRDSAPALVAGTTREAAINLAPCPFCGGTDVAVDPDIEGVTCHGCMATGPSFLMSDELPTDEEANARAEAGWNRRLADRSAR